MSNSFPILIDTTNAQSKTTIKTTTTAQSTLRPEALQPSKLDASINAHEKEEKQIPSIPHSNQVNEEMPTITTETAAPVITHNIHRQHDETEAIADISSKRKEYYQKQQHYHNHHQITAKPLTLKDNEHNSEHLRIRIHNVHNGDMANKNIDENSNNTVMNTLNNRLTSTFNSDDVSSNIIKSTFGNSDHASIKASSVSGRQLPPPPSPHKPLSSSSFSEETLAHYQTQSLSWLSLSSVRRNFSKLSKSTLPNVSSATWTYNKQSQIETLTLVCVFILIVALVICMVFSIRHRSKSSKHCDKINLINNSGSCSRNSFCECEMDFSGSTNSIIPQSIAMNV